MKTAMFATALLLATGAVGGAAVALLSDPGARSAGQPLTRSVQGGELSTAGAARIDPTAPSPAQALLGNPVADGPASPATLSAPVAAATSLEVARAAAAPDASRQDTAPANPAAARRELQRERLARLGADTDETTRLDAAREVLAAVGTAEADDQLVLRSLAVITKLDPGKVPATVHELLRSTGAGEESQAALARALVPLSRQEDVLASGDLLTCYDLGSRPVQRVAAAALARRGDDTLSLRLAERCADELYHADGGVRAEAVRDLTALSAPELTKQVAPLLADAEPEVRLASLRALERSTDPLVQDRLRALVDDPAPHVRSVARRAVMRLDRPVEPRGDEAR